MTIRARRWVAAASYPARLPRHHQRRLPAARFRRGHAIVFDAPVRRHHLKLTRSINETLVGGIFARENYGIALPTGSALRKKITETLLGITADGTYDELYSKYFGDAGSG